MDPTLRAKENLHIVFWLIKDLCWVLVWRPLGMVMIVPTVAMAVHIAWRTRHDPDELPHSLAVVCWILANSVWMVGEFYLDDGTRPVALVLFLMGLASVAWYHLVRRPKLRRAAAGPGAGKA